MQDLKLAFRQLRKFPGFATTVIITLALGIGANTAIFSLVNAILLHSLPVTDPATLYRIGDRDDCCVNGGFLNDDGDFDLFSYDLFLHLRDAAPEFEQLAAFQSGHETVNARRGSELGKPERSEYVTGNYFQTFGVGAYLGRTLLPTDDVPGAAPAVMMSYQAWQADYASDPKVVGSVFYIQAHPVTIVGIGPPGFFGDRIDSDPPALWIPLSDEPVIEGKNTILHIPGSNWLYAIGRLKPGTSVAALQTKLSVSLRQWLSSQPEYVENGGQTFIPKQHVVLAPAGAGVENMQQETASGLHLLVAIAALVLLVACANVANLLLARGTTRRAETSVRMALGAARSRLIRQMLVEAVLLGCVGGAIGLVIAYAGTRTILALAFPDAKYLPIHASPSLPVLGFAFGVSLLTGIVFGIVPAWIASHSDPAEALRGVNRSTRDRSSLPQKGLIVFQAALSLVLLVSAGLLTKTLRNLEHQRFGVETADRYVVHLDPAGAGYTSERLPALYEQMEHQFAAIPGVQSVGLALYSPLEGNNWGEGVYIAGRPAPGPDAHNGSSWDRVSPQFFETIGQPLVRARGFTDQDTATSQMVTVVNQAFVKKFFPHEDPIGHHFGTFDQKYANNYEIVGVVADAKYNDPHDPFRPMYFRPLTQPNTEIKEPEAITAESRSLYINSITLRFRSQPQNVDALVRRTLASIDPNLTVIDLKSLDYQVADNFNQQRLIARLTMLFGLLALVLASVGLYGITAYSVALRTGEIGVRMALGANRRDVVGLVLRGAFSQIGIGLLVGIPLAFLAGRLMASQLYGVSAYDPFSVAIAAIVLFASATIAGFVPAQRAATIEPMQALRSE
ncbi:MAG TPA: ABC transporter permease [Terriglobales bacterium]|nr:ABC transporter permease [Terriglobales bacterium]